MPKLPEVSALPAGKRLWRALLGFAQKLIPAESDPIDRDERLAHVRTISLIALVAGAVFSVFNLLREDMRMLGLTEAAVTVGMLLPAQLLGRRGTHLELAENLVLAATLILPSALVIFGGVEGTGLFWVYVVPFTLFFFKGQRQGWIYSVVFMLIVAICFVWIAPWVPGSYRFSEAVSVQFLLSLVFYTVVAAAFNHARVRFEHQLRLGKLQAEEAYQAKSRFLAAASHDLRQPAHALGLFVARLNQLPMPAQTRGLVSGVDASVRALQEMLDAFFDYTRLDAQLMQVQVRPVAVEDIFVKLRSNFLPLAEEKGLRLRIRPSREWVLTDPVLLHRILLNLLGNALQHTEVGSILVACRPSAEPGMLRIEVRDNGVGIAKEHHTKVFEEFYQVDNRARDRNKGLGLGLSIVQRSCRLLGHQVHLQSDLGCGARFCLQLARSTAQPDTPATTLDAALGADLQGLQVLLIEDDALGGTALAGLLESWGCTVALVERLEQAGAAPFSGAPDFILTDYRLPGMHTGVDSVALLRAQFGWAIPACVISGDTDEGVRTRVAQAGLTLLQKPVRPAKLRSVLRHTFLAKTHKNGDNP